MPTEVRNQQAQKVVATGGSVNSSAHPPEPENLPCPRCDSTNTKFCYYNNYNLSQPRYFCKACRRYWTRGGTLRNVPVGGGSRKNSKRSRSSSATSSSVTPAALDNTVPFGGAVTMAAHEAAGLKTEMPSCDVDLNLNEGSFTSLLSCSAAGVTQAVGGGGYVGLPHGYGVGLGLGYGPSSGFEEMGFGLAFGPAVTGANQHGGGNSWQLQLCNGGGGDGVMDGEDCFVWPDLAISTPGNALQ